MTTPPDDTTEGTRHCCPNCDPHAFVDESATVIGGRRLGTAPVTAEGLRERLIGVATGWALMYPLANWPWPGRTLAGADAEHLDAIARDIAAAWGGDIADRVLAEISPVLELLRSEAVAALAGDPGDLPARMLTAARAAGFVYDRSALIGFDWDDYLKAVIGKVMSVRWEDHAATVARLAQAEAQVAAIRTLITEDYGEDYDDEDVPAAVERLMRHLSKHEANVQRLRQSKNEALERAEAEVERLRAELAEAREQRDAALHSSTELGKANVEWQQAQSDALKRSFAAEAERDALKAAIEQVRRLQKMTIATSCRAQAIDQAHDTLAVLDRALAAPETIPDAPGTPGDAERIADERPVGVHAFKQNPEATQVSVCICGKWRDHHVHGADPCGCDACRTPGDATPDAPTEETDHV